MVLVHWIVSEGPPSVSPHAARVTLTAALSGPYADVAGLKNASAAAPAVSAVPVHTTDRATGAPVSRLVIPAAAPSGFYNLTFTVDLRDGTRTGASVIRVAAATGD